METFSLLKYWIDRRRRTQRSGNDNAAVTSSGDENEGDYEGPFINLELAVHENDCDNEETVLEDEADQDGEEGVYSKSTEDDKKNMGVSLSCMSSSSAEIADVVLHGKLLSVNSYSLSSTQEKNETGVIYPTTSLLVKSVTKFRVFLLRFKRSKPTKEQQSLEGKEEERNATFFTVKIKVEEASSARKNRLGYQKRFSKDTIQRYAKMVKPLSVRASRRYANKLGLSGGQEEESQSQAGGNEPEMAAPVRGEVEEVPNTRGMRIVAGLLMTKKRLRIRRSASATVAAAPSTAAHCGRRDDSLREQHDGIQGAILHCKRSLIPIPIAADSEAGLNPRAGKEEEETEGVIVKELHPEQYENE